MNSILKNKIKILIEKKKRKEEALFQAS